MMDLALQTLIKGVAKQLSNLKPGVVPSVAQQSALLTKVTKWGLEDAAVCCEVGRLTVKWNQHHINLSHMSFSLSLNKSPSKGKYSRFMTSKCQALSNAGSTIKASPSQVTIISYHVTLRVKNYFNHVIYSTHLLLGIINALGILVKGPATPSPDQTFHFTALLMLYRLYPWYEIKISSMRIQLRIHLNHNTHLGDLGPPC